MYTYTAIIPHVTKPMVGVLFEHDRWWLPRWQERDRHSWQNVEHVNAAMRDHYALEVTTLRCYSTSLDDATSTGRRVYEFENRSPAWSPPGRGRWITRDALDALPFGDPEERQILSAWFDEVLNGVPSKRRPWARRGWLDSTRNWIRDQLRMQGITLLGVEQVRTWERACVLRARTNAGTCYLKALPTMFAAEAPLTHALSAWYPRNFPGVVAVEPSRRWLLLRDFGGQPLDRVHDISAWESALRRLAEIQIGLALRQNELQGLGVPFRPLDDLPRDLAALLDDPAVARIPNLKATALQRLRDELPAFATLRDELAGFTIPLTLEHGDLWANTIIWADGTTPLYFEWSDASVTHPFFSLILFLDEAVAAFPELPNAGSRLLTAYLAPWSLYKSDQELRRAMEIARILGPLHHAVAYHRAILPMLEQKWEMENLLPFYLNMALARMDGTNDITAPPAAVTPTDEITPIQWAATPSNSPTRRLTERPASRQEEDPLKTSLLPKIDRDQLNDRP